MVVERGSVSVTPSGLALGAAARSVPSAVVEASVCCVSPVERPLASLAAAESDRSEVTPSSTGCPVEATNAVSTVEYRQAIARTMYFDNHVLVS